MYKLLFAEDESAAREGILEGLDWSGLGVGEVRAEKNGALACTEARAFHPDILLTDIKMPHMNGIELARKVREINPECSILIISGYSEAEYLKSAIRLHAVNFVEKPVDLGVLARQVRSAANEQDAVRRNKKSMRMELAAALSSPEAREEKAAGILRTLYPRLERGCLCRAVCFRVLTKDLHEKPEADLERIFSAAEARISGCGFPYAAAIHKNCFTVFLFGEACESDSVTKLCDVLTGEFPEDSVFAGVGGTVPVESGRGSLDTAARALSQLFYGTEKQRVWTESDIPKEFGKKTFSPDLRDFSKLLLGKDREGCKKYVSGVTQRLLSLRTLTPYQAAEIYLQMLLTLLQQEGRNLRVESDSAWEWLSSCVFLREMEQELLAETDRCFASFFSGDRGFSADRVLEFISRNYADKTLSLDRLSREFYISNAYLCVKFKELTGKSFVKYLTEYRVRAAENYLADRALKIDEIADMVGFDNGNYFCKIFKKEKGVTPTEYRKHL